MSRLAFRCLMVGSLFLAGCARQDTEILARVGKQLGSKAQTATAPLRERLPFRITSATVDPAPADAKPVDRSLTDRVQLRLTGEKALAGVTIDVQVRGADVELKGMLANEDQKRRAVDLAESTVGVEKVIDSLQIREAKAAE